MKKLLSKKGETLVETLVATLIVSCCSVMLCGAIVTAARVNKSAETINEDATATDAGVSSVSINYGASSKSVTVELYEINGNYYYEKK